MIEPIAMFIVIALVVGTAAAVVANYRKK